MSTDQQTARRYLLGQTGDEESSRIEQEYFRDDQALERMEACEEELVEDYLDARLAPGDRAAFEAHYLSTPERRTRLQTIRRLEKAARGRPHRVPVRWLAAAAVLLIGAGIAWMVPGSRQNAPPIASPTPTAAVPRVFAVTLTPATVRGDSETPRIAIPPATDVVTLDLQGERDSSIASMEVVISTAGGDRVWEGAADAAGPLPAGVSARVSVPAAALRPDDYIVVLSGTDRAGAERERNRYFLRVRTD